MSVHNHHGLLLTRPPQPAAALLSPACKLNMISHINNTNISASNCTWKRIDGRRLILHAIAGSIGNSGTAGGANGGDGGVKKKGVPNSNYVVPLDKSLASAYTSCITRPLAEILRDLNKRIPDNIIKPPNSSSTLIPWYVLISAMLLLYC